MGSVVDFPFTRSNGDMNTVRKRKLEPPLEDIVARNIQYFYEKQWKQGEAKGKTVYNSTKSEGNPTRETLELVAKRARIPVWYLFLDLPKEKLESRDLVELVDIYLSLDKNGQESLLNIARLTRR